MINKIAVNYPILGSSKDSTKLSLTVQSILLALVPLIIGIGSINGLEIAKADLTGLIQALTGVISAVMFLYGAGRKVYYKYFR